jgi:hypothetical protein
MQPPHALKSCANWTQRRQWTKLKGPGLFGKIPGQLFLLDPEGVKIERNVEAAEAKGREPELMATAPHG